MIEIDGKLVRNTGDVLSMANLTEAEFDVILNRKRKTVIVKIVQDEDEEEARVMVDDECVWSCRDE